MHTNEVLYSFTFWDLSLSLLLIHHAECPNAPTCHLVASLHHNSSQFTKHRLLQRPNIQLLRPRTPWLRMQIPIYLRQVPGLHNIRFNILQLLLRAFSLPLPSPDPTNQFPINGSVDDQMRAMNAFDLVLASDYLSEGAESEFSRREGREAWHAAEGASRTGKEDRSALLGEHVRQHGFGRPKRTEEVYLREAFEFLGRRVEYASAIHSSRAGVVHKHIHWTEFGFDLLEASDDVRLDAEVCDVVLCGTFAVVLFDTVGHGLQLILRSRQQRCDEAFCDELAGDGFADAWAGAHYCDDWLLGRVV